MKELLAALFTCLILIPTQGLRAQIVAGPITNATTGHYYYLVGPAYWTNAQAQATNLGGHLAVIDDAAENAWILETFGNYGGVSRVLMIGLTDESQEGQWRWSNGDPVSYVNWAPGEPNNGQGIFSYENVGIMYGAGDPRAGLWNDMMGTLEEQQYWGVIEVTPQAELTIRVSEVEVSWFALSGIHYQPQYRLSLTTNVWMDLGSPVPGTGSVTYLRDPVPIGAPRRFYRVVATP
jgi:lectin-like protein